MNRRTLLLASPSLLLLGGCPSQSTSQIAMDISAIATGLQGLDTAIAAIPNVPAATLAQIGTYLGKIQAAASAVAASAPTGSVLQQVITAVQSLVPLVAPLLPAGSVWGPLLQAALSLVPELAVAAGLTGAVPNAAPVYTPAQARALLTGNK